MFLFTSRARLIAFAPLSGTAVFLFFVLLHGNIKLGILLSVLAVLVTYLGKVGTELGSDRKAYRECFVLFGWRLGRWQPLPKVVGVTLKYFSSMSGGDRTPSGPASWGIWNKGPQRHEELVVMLSLEHSNTGLIIKRFELDDVNQAIDTAHDIAEFFDVPVHQFLPPAQFQPLNPS